MPVYPVTIPATADLVVPEGVGIPNTDGTRHVLLIHAEPKPILQAESELPVMEMKTQVEGVTFSQSPACGRAEERARALERVSGDETRRSMKTASSMQWQRGRCRNGTSISSSVVHSGLSAAIERPEMEVSR